MKSGLLKALVMASLCLTQWGASAEDTDIFAPSASATSDAPNVLLVLDNGAGFSADAGGTTCALATPDSGTVATGAATNTFMSGKAGGIEQCALFNVIQGLDITKTNLRLGVMVYKGSQVVNYLGTGCTGSDGGGCLVYPIQDFNATNKVALLKWIKKWSVSNGDVGGSWIKASEGNSGGGVGASMQEAWAYFKGKTGLSGTNYANNQPPVGCAKNFVIFIGNAWGNSSPNDLANVEDALSGSISPATKRADPAATASQLVKLLPNATNSGTVCGTVSVGNSVDQIPSSVNSHESSGMYGDEWARYMAANGITTYTIGLVEATCTRPAYPWLLESMAVYGTGKYFSASNYAALNIAIGTVLSEVQSVNSAFAAVSLPVSVNTQGTYLNQVFVGMFRPDQDSLPNWLGNLKQYKVGYVGSTLQLVDADGAAGISSSGSGFIAECARSFWTPGLASTDSYWSTIAKANCAGYDASSNTPDGNMVEKGGSGYKLRAATPSSRVMKTCGLGATCTLADFNTSNTAITYTLLGTTAGDRDNLINWARGTNVQGEQAASVTLTDARPSVHGDVVHSRPAAINFGTDSAPKVVVFYGGNDGMLRAINGNRGCVWNDTTKTCPPDPLVGMIGTVTAGSELWSFMPPEFYGKLKRRYDKTGKITTTNIAGTGPKDYAMDGSVASFSTSTTSDAWVYASMRRGGRAVYAFNVAHASPATITSKWKVGCDSSGCFTASGSSGNNGDFSGIGQTWATPTFFNASGYVGGSPSAPLPLSIMGGGYDSTCEDSLTFTCGSTTGNHIYVMDANSGTLLKVFDTTRSVTGDVLIVKDSSGNATYGYAADLGGNVYRISGATANTPIGTTLPADWTLTKIASLGCDVPGACTSPPNRKFLYGPDVVVDGDTNFVMLGSGNRERPTDTANAVTNHFFMLKDKPTDTTWLTDEAVAGRCGGGNALLCMASLAAPVTAGTTCATMTSTTKGWALQMAANEQVVTSAVTVYGTVYFSTSQPVAPAANSCTSNLGVARSYSVAYTNASLTGTCGSGNTTDPQFVTLSGGGLPLSPVVAPIQLDPGSVPPGSNQSQIPIVCFGCGSSSSTMQARDLGKGSGGTAVSVPAIRTYRYIKK